MKRVKVFAVYVIFPILLIGSAYLYSQRWDFLGLGSSQRDGLFFLSFYMAILPLLIASAIAKAYLLKNGQSTFIKYSFFIYTLLVSLPSLDTFGSQIALGFGVCLCFISCVCIFIEIVKGKTLMLK